MPAENKTLPCRGASGSKLIGRPPHSYTPGAPEARKKRRKTSNYASLPSEVMDKIVNSLVSDRKPLSVMLLSMVSREFRRAVDQNLKAWHQLYLLWRGHMKAMSLAPGAAGVLQGKRGGTVRLVPTVPRSVPNFRDKHPPLA